MEERRREDHQSCRGELQVAYDVELGLLHPQRLKVLGCEKESEVRSEDDSEEEETYRTTGSSTSSRTQQRSGSQRASSRGLDPSRGGRTRTGRT